MFHDVKLEAMKVVNKEFESFITTQEYTDLLEAVDKRQSGDYEAKAYSSDAKAPGGWASCLGISPRKAEAKGFNYGAK